jgi:polyphosphate kinase
MTVVPRAKPMTQKETPSYPEPHIDLPSGQSAYFNRELSWLEFNRRVLEEALDTRNPLLERVKFLAIFASNLDEFFMIRVSAIKQQVAAGVQKHSPDGLTPTEQLAAIRRILVPMLEQERHLLLDVLLPSLAAEGIYLLDYDQLHPSQVEEVKTYFEQEVFPVLTPLAFDTSHPFPHISNLSLNLAVEINDPEEGSLFARIKVPEVLPRLIPISNVDDPKNPQVGPERRYSFVWLEQVIAAHIHTLFPGLEVIATYPFRVTRNADMEIEEDEAGDLLRTIEQSVLQRRFGEVVRISVHAKMPEHIRNLLLANLKIKSNDLYAVTGPLGLSDLLSLMSLDRPDLKDPPFVAKVPAALRGHTDIFSAIRQQDILLHHPYDSFMPLVDLIKKAATDPQVLAIKQTLYRVGTNSPIVNALMQAREEGKQVTVLVELKARFDEANNITWARALERAGVHVVYGLLGLKTHAKLALIVRKEPDGLRRYVHLGTGNYNASTARLYTDLGLLTCRPDIGADVSELFNFLTGYSRQNSYRKLLVAPITLRSGLIKLIQNEIDIQNNGGTGRIIFKMNSLTDPEMINALYAAAQAGVEIDLIVRGVCCLRPNIPGLSERIRVRSIVGRFLEHSRIFYFRNNGDETLYLGSADLMERNLDRRVETLFPIEDQNLLRHIHDDLLQSYLKDSLNARDLQPDGSYLRGHLNSDDPHIDSQSPYWLNHDV